ncbi:MAG: hypothetical protein KatS3mg032_0148 [Cyclobacteriaceae bacterium]|nr:MAG: hypothetical protein KatS3mg032_0148 [Cyclobacteriaceae bacterium]
MKNTAIIFILVSCLALVAQAQIQTPAASPAGSVSTVVGLTEVSIKYSRPRMRGRKIFGQGPDYLVPYGQMWRTGANAGTVITFSDDVKVEGLDVKKGDYLLLNHPRCQRMDGYSVQRPLYWRQRSQLQTGEGRCPF